VWKSIFGKVLGSQWAIGTDPYVPISAHIMADYPHFIRSSSVNGSRSDPKSAPGKQRLAATIAGVVVALDAVTKAIATHALAGRGVVNLLGGAFHLELYRNFAGPGNILRGHPVLVSVLSLIAVVLIAVAAWSVRTTTFAIALGLLLGGGIGNLLDRLLRAPGPLRGGVVDWIKPTLSGGSLDVADLAINAALIALVVGLTIEWYRDRRDRDQDQDRDQDRDRDRDPPPREPAL
jgi:signal peptidase II